MLWSTWEQEHLRSKPKPGAPSCFSSMPKSRRLISWSHQRHMDHDGPAVTRSEVPGGSPKDRINPRDLHILYLNIAYIAKQITCLFLIYFYYFLLYSYHFMAHGPWWRIGDSKGKNMFVQKFGFPKSGDLHLTRCRLMPKTWARTAGLYSL